MNKKLTWDERYALAKSYYEHHGNLRVVSSFKTKDGYTYDEGGFELGNWISGQRQRYRLNELTPEHYDKLKSIGMVFDYIGEIDWENFYALAQIYLRYYKNLSIPRNFKTKNGYEKDETGKNLGAWLNAQKLNYRSKKLTPERMKKIEKLFEELEANKKAEKESAELEWDRMYNLAKAYYEYYGHLNISANFITTNGYEKDEKGSNLGNWIRKQRKSYNKGNLNEEQIQKFEQIGMIFSDISKTEWDRMYNLAKAYYNYYGNLKVSRNFRTKNGYEKDENGSNLGKWVNKQYCRNIHGLISKEEFEKLKAIGMVFENQKEDNWNKMYNLAKAYYEHFGHLNVVTSFKTQNGYEEDSNGQDLGIWLSAQRRHYVIQKISPRHVERLKAIGMIFENVHEARWEKMYNLAEIYYKHYENLVVDIDFVTTNGYIYNSKGEKLGIWINVQRANYKNGILSADREEKLRNIGIVFENMHDIEWNRMYNLAVVYYKQNGHLRIPTNFKTDDGYKYSINGQNLGGWISRQRTKYKTGQLSQEQFTKLQAIGMIFDLVKDKHLNQNECIKNGIDYLKYKEQIDAIPHREFAAKINYLNSQSMSLVINEMLHPIFSMSSINMQMRYGISLENLINEYQNQTDKIKRI